MLHLTLFLYLLSLIAASASITGAVVFYFRYRNKALMYYALMLAVVTLLLLHRMAGIYCLAMELNHFAMTRLALAAIEKCAFVTGVFAGPVFMHLLLGIELTALRKRIYLLIACLYSIGAIAEIALGTLPAARILRDGFSLPFLFGMYGYCLLYGILTWRKLGSPLIKSVVIALLGISIVVLPFSLYQYITGHPYFPGFMERPLLFLVFFGASILFTIRYFNHPAYVENQKPTAYFRERFALTDREGEIIAEAIKGSSNQEIADKLFISPRTVESHLYSIFQKVGVKNRVQLANLMQANSQ